jgi:hypothetical protein
MQWGQLTARHEWSGGADIVLNPTSQATTSVVWDISQKILIINEIYIKIHKSRSNQKGVYMATVKDSGHQYVR